MKPDQNDAELITRWIDGELDEAARAALESNLDPARRAQFEKELASAASIGDLLRHNYPADRDVAGPELFMHQLAHRIDRAGEATVAPAKPGRYLPMAGWLATAAAVVLGLFAAGRMLPGPKPAEVAGPARGVLVPATDVLFASYVPDASLHAESGYNEAADAVVIVIDGLKPIESPEELLGFRADDPRPMKARLAGTVHPHQFRFRGGSSES